ncbi:hypothetical protein HPB49_004583 [Dermacentor silvarum]|uniref:Uncharacterized protein n=1 Tax=Dermacentor silvarum TaxID=543639 RepID=A0ACB8DB04_DERSI|nr:hypothetical protein HPB49_004583 [Dermacentor silvarum]
MVVRDSGYPLEPWLLTPVPGHPTRLTAEGRYNEAHAVVRNAAERCIGILKSRFRCLQRYRTLHYSPRKAATIVAACAALHNLCLQAGIRCQMILKMTTQAVRVMQQQDKCSHHRPHRCPWHNCSSQAFLGQSLAEQGVSHLSDVSSLLSYSIGERPDTSRETDLPPPHPFWGTCFCLGHPAVGL